MSARLGASRSPAGARRACDVDDMTYAAVQKHPRYKVSVPVDVLDPDGQLHALRLDDVSLGGVFIATPAPAPPGSVVRVLLPLEDDGAPLQVRGRVVHVLDEAAGKAKERAQGMGVQFDDLEADAARALHRFVDGLAAQARRIALRDAAETAASLALVLAHARRLIAHDVRDDPRAGLGLPDDASFDEAMVRAHELARTFADAYADASPPQRARLAQAGSALAALEATLWARAREARPRAVADEDVVAIEDDAPADGGDDAPM
jgi:uncharacterized protein (TIGR02266 family)